MKVFVTHDLPGKALSRLKRKHHVRVHNKDKVLTKKELLDGVRWCDALLCLLTDTIDKTLINANPKLKIIANYAVGYDNIDVAHATKKGILVSNTPGVLTNAVAEHTFALVMALARRIPEADRFTRKGKYKGWKPNLLLGQELKGKTLGIIGLGRIGMRVAHIAANGLGMRVLYTDIRRNKEFEKEVGAKYGSKGDILKNADAITLHVPLLPSTKHLIGAQELRMMKKTTVLINTSRGPVVNEKSLLAALKRKTIAGAALDVFEKEPKLTSGLTKLENVILTPHIASASMEARSAMADLAVENIIAALAKKRPLNLVNPEAFS
jgi:D-3-phosphoglycerate dehydrogenase